MKLLIVRSLRVRNAQINCSNCDSVLIEIKDINIVLIIFLESCYPFSYLINLKNTNKTICTFKDPIRIKIIMD